MAADATIAAEPSSFYYGSFQLSIAPSVLLPNIEERVCSSRSHRVARVSTQIKLNIAKGSKLILQSVIHILCGSKTGYLHHRHLDLSQSELLSGLNDSLRIGKI